MKIEEKIASFIFVALSCEAKPLIKHYQLKKLNTPHPFAIYTHKSLALIITGVGKSAMAAGVAYALAVLEKVNLPVLINVGIGGHQQANLGTLFVANKVTDVDSKRSFYPQLFPQLGMTALPIETVSKPQTHYQSEKVYDMEASAFYEIATLFSVSELIHCFKIISDNQNSSVKKIDAKKVQYWVDLQIQPMEQALQHLQNLRQQLNTFDSPYLETILKQWHFSVSSEIRLKALLQRWQVLNNDAELDLSIASMTNAKSCLRYLEQQIDGLDFEL